MEQLIQNSDPFVMVNFGLKFYFIYGIILLLEYEIKYLSITEKSHQI